MRAATSLRRIAETRIERPPEALVVLTAQPYAYEPYAYERDDGVFVVPLGLLGP